MAFDLSKIDLQSAIANMLGDSKPSNITPTVAGSPDAYQTKNQVNGNVTASQVAEQALAGLRSPVEYRERITSLFPRSTPIDGMERTPQQLLEAGAPVTSPVGLDVGGTMPTDTSNYMPMPLGGANYVPMPVAPGAPQPDIAVRSDIARRISQVAAQSTGAGSSRIR